MMGDQESQLPGRLGERWWDAMRRGLSRQGWLLVVDASTQAMFALCSGRLESEHLISTSGRGLGEEEDSYRTPRGIHEVADQIGDKQPPGAVFKSRVPTGFVLGADEWKANSEEDMILTRILRLRGMEPGINRGPGIDSYDRNIYIHGTNQEQLLGTPASHGCIRMANLEIVRLFDQIRNEPAWCIVD